MEEHLHPSPGLVSTVTSNGPPHGLFRLPVELRLIIMEDMAPHNFINFALATYSLLRPLHWNLVPRITPERVRQMKDSTHVASSLFQRLPNELILDILGRLRRVDMMRYVFMDYQVMVVKGIAPALTLDTIKQLKKASLWG
jgi:hypothetical protein